MYKNKQLALRSWFSDPCVRVMCIEFGHLMQRADSLEKTLMLGKIEGRRRKKQQRMK